MKQQENDDANGGRDRDLKPVRLEPRTACIILRSTSGKPLAWIVPADAKGWV